MDPISLIGGLVTTLLGKFFPDKDTQLKQQFVLELQTRLGELDIAKGQLEINKAEASAPNRSWITWRELIGYCCAFSVMWTYCLQPFMTYFVVLYSGQAPNLPELDMSQLMMLLFTMLGMGGMSMYEKVKGVKK